MDLETDLHGFKGKQRMNGMLSLTTSDTKVYFNDLGFHYFQKVWGTVAVAEGDINTGKYEYIDEQLLSVLILHFPPDE